MIAHSSKVFQVGIMNEYHYSVKHSFSFVDRRLSHQNNSLLTKYMSLIAHSKLHLSYIDGIFLLWSRNMVFKKDMIDMRSLMDPRKDEREDRSFRLCRKAE